MLVCLRNCFPVHDIEVLCPEWMQQPVHRRSFLVIIHTLHGAVRATSWHLCSNARPPALELVDG